MAKLNRRAGQNIRDLAAKRRFKAIVSFVSAGLVLLLPLILARAFESFLKQTLSSNSAQVPTTLQLPVYLYIVFVIAALSSVLNGIHLWKRANHADQGAKGEEDTAQEMSPLEQAGWQVEYGMQLGSRLGDADIVCISPRNKAYVIDVKSHRGEVTTDGNRLYRRMGKNTYPFEKNFLDQVMKQALQVKKQKSLDFVTPIVAFSNAKVSVPPGKPKKVLVVEKSKLVSLLKSLG